MKLFVICFILTRLIIDHQCGSCIDDPASSNPTNCATCTGGICDCPGYSRNGFPCSANVDVRITKYIGLVCQTRSSQIDQFKARSNS